MTTSRTSRRGSQGRGPSSHGGGKEPRGGRGGVREHYITYDLEQRTRGGGTAIYPKVKRVYIPGTVTGWEYGEFEKRSGRKARGVRIDYKQRRKGYERAGYTAHRRGTTYEVQPAQVGPVDQHFTRILEVPERAMNVQYRGTSLPARYRRARQDID